MADQKALTTVVSRVGKWDGSMVVDSAAHLVAYLVASKDEMWVVE